MNESMDLEPATSEPLDAEELMAFSERIDALPSADAEWVGRLWQECLRARLREAELLTGGEPAAPDCGQVRQFDEQLAQVALDAAEWLKTLWNVGYMGAGSFPSQPRSAFPLIELEDVLKSALFARIREGKRPLPFPPPTRHGLPWHSLVECDKEATHDVDAEIVRDDQGRIVGVIIEACADWQVVEEMAENSEYVVQHRGKGPLYRLCLDFMLSTLRREPPRWTRVIRQQERAGFRSFTLEWPGEGGAIQSEPLRAATWERAESEADFWIATRFPEMYGQVRFERAG
ncbi:MAG: hypothetical protein QM739_06470 [Propionivibrio sp.]